MPEATRWGTWRKTAQGTLGGVLVVLALLVPVLLVYAFGWPHTLQGETLLYSLSSVALMVFGVCELAQLPLADNPKAYARRNAVLLGMAVLAIASGAASGSIVGAFLGAGSFGAVKFVLLGYIIVSQVALLITLLLRVLRDKRRRWFMGMQPRTVVIASFISLILLGAALLKTPNATVGHLGWLDALFTSTSAVCVTGLIVVDTATVFTHTGQAIILCLIQLGGLGLMTYTFFLAMLAGEGISLHDRVLLREMLSERNLSFVSRTLVEILFVTLAIEGIGAALILHSWNADGTWAMLDLWHAVFHSVSAFCNAGFSTLTGNLADPAVAGRTGLQGIIMCLIVLGGLGFPVLRELRQRALGLILPRRYPRPTHMSLHTRIVLSMTALLIVGGAGVLLLCQMAHLSDLPVSPWRAVFDSVTARTAGFNIEDMGRYSTPVVVMLMLLMFIGGSPAGTAGGIKTTTFALAILNLWATVRGRREIQVGWRSIPEDLANQAFAVFVISLIWIALAIFAMVLAEPGKDFLDLVFETVSAFGTVGLSRGVTSSLSEPGKLIIIATMFIGRVGLIVIAYALLHSSRTTKFNLPKEPVGLT